MKALVKTEKGYDKMELIDIEEPNVNDDQVKIKVAYSGICGSDIHSFKGEYSNIKVPVALGHEFSGTVVDIGKNVKKVKIGDKVTSETTFYICGECEYCKSGDYNLCSSRKGVGTQVNGSFAEYVIARGESVHVLPKNVDMLSAALTEPLACCTHAVLEKTDIKEGEFVLVFGPGPIGTLAAQVAKSRGGRVILAGMNKDKKRLELAKSIGIDYVVNIEEENLEEIVNKLTNNYGVNKAIECSGSIHAANSALKLLKKKGVLIQMGIFAKSSNLLDQEMIIQKEIEYIGTRSQKPSSWELALRLLDTGKVNAKDLVSDIYKLEDWRTGFEKVINGEGFKIVIES